MTYRISTTTTDIGTTFQLANERGDLARTTSCAVFTTPDLADAEHARDYLNGVKGVGGQKLKSMFGKRR